MAKPARTLLNNLVFLEINNPDQTQKNVSSILVSYTVLKYRSQPIPATKIFHPLMEIALHCCSAVENLQSIQNSYPLFRPVSQMKKTNQLHYLDIFCCFVHMWGTRTALKISSSHLTIDNFLPSTIPTKNAGPGQVTHY